MPTATCLVCGDKRFHPYLDILLKCPTCGFVTAHQGGATAIGQLYEGEYVTGAEYLDYLADEPLFRRTFHRRLNEILDRKPGGRLLEIGAAYGFFLDLARRHFDAIGFELNQEAARHGRDHFGVDIRTEDFLRIDRRRIGDSFDVTVMWDVIEHLERPDLFLARVAELSHAGALVYLTTGDIGSLVARLRGRKWRLIHPPSHLHYFDRNTIARLLDRHGFRVIQIRTAGVARSFRQILYSVLALRLGQPDLYASIKKAVPPSWGFTLDLRDIMLVVANRKDEGGRVRR